jgi:hypothetical protein
MANVDMEKETGGLIDRLMIESVDDSKWLAKNYAKLARLYPDKFVAVFNKKVVASHQDITKLMKLVDRRLPKAARLVSTEFVTRKKATVIL